MSDVSQIRHDAAGLQCRLEADQLVVVDFAILINSSIEVRTMDV